MKQTLYIILTFMGQLLSAQPFTEVPSADPFEGVDNSSIAFSDVDGDGDPDVLITGPNVLGVLILKLYTNDGAGNFTETVGTPFTIVSSSSIAFSDVDGDGDPDVLITGNNSSGSISKLYTNDGAGNFTEVLGTPFVGVYFSSMAFSDVDGDGDPDVLITGRNGSNAAISKLYTNDRITSSIEDKKKGLRFDFMLYPNPSSTNKISVSYISEEKGSVTIKVFDLNGRLLKVQEGPIGIGEHIVSIEITSLTKGSYFIQLDDGKRKGARKLWVQ